MKSLLIMLLLLGLGLRTWATEAERALESARNLIQQGQNEQALPHLDRALKLDPKLCEAHVLRGKVMRTRGDLSAALAAFDAAVTCDTNSAWAYYYRGTTKYWMETPALAVEDYNRAIGLDPKTQQFWNDRASSYRKLGKYKEAIADLDEAIRLKPNIPFFRRNRGDNYTSLGQRERAMKDYDAAVRLAPNDERYRKDRVTCSFALRRWEHALLDMEFFVRKDPRQPGYRSERAMVYAMLGRYQESIRDYEKAIELRKNAEGYTFLITAVLASGDTTNALRQINQFVTEKGWRHPDSPYMPILGAIIHQRQGDKAGAKTLLDEAHRQLDHKAWPYPVVAWLRGDSKWEDLFAFSGDKVKATEIHTYAAMTTGDKKSAREHLRWVLDHGETGNSEYVLANAELNRIEPK